MLRLLKLYLATVNLTMPCNQPVQNNNPTWTFDHVGCFYNTTLF